MPFGCFGKRKKKDKSAKSPDAASGSEAVKAGASPSEVAVPVSDEQVVAVRARGLNAEAIAGDGQRAASLARSDFLRKSDYSNSADRWVALKQQYLTPKMSQSHHAGASLDAATSQRKAAIKSLPREFSPPSTVVSVVKFSQWFYDRQVKEEEARREAHEREERTRALVEQQLEADAQAAAAEAVAAEAAAAAAEAEAAAAAEASSAAEADAAAAIQASFKAFQTRKQIADSGDNKLLEGESHQQQPEPPSTPVIKVSLADSDSPVAVIDPELPDEQLQQQQQQQQEEHSQDEMNAAAVKIQAGFKGYKTRKQMGKVQQQQQQQQEALSSS